MLCKTTFVESVNYMRLPCVFLAMKIQISGECKKYLDDLGGWVIERRGIIDVKVTQCRGRLLSRYS